MRRFGDTDVGHGNIKGRQSAPAEQDEETAWHQNRPAGTNAWHRHCARICTAGKPSPERGAVPGRRAFPVRPQQTE